jgi:hypothetical protein
MGDVEAPSREVNTATTEVGHRVRSRAPRLPVVAIVLAVVREHQAELADLHLVAVEQP